MHVFACVYGSTLRVGSYVLVENAKDLRDKFAANFDTLLSGLHVCLGSERASERDGRGWGWGRSRGARSIYHNVLHCRHVPPFFLSLHMWYSIPRPLRPRPYTHRLPLGLLRAAAVGSVFLFLDSSFRMWDLVVEIAQQSGVEVDVRRPRWSRAVLKHQRLCNLCNNVLVLIKRS